MSLCTHNSPLLLNGVQEDGSFRVVIEQEFSASEVQWQRTAATLPNNAVNRQLLDLNHS